MFRGVHAAVRCENCRKAASEFFSRTENRDFIAELAKLSTAERAKSNSIRERVKKMIQDMETYVRECAAKRKQT